MLTAQLQIINNQTHTHTVYVYDISLSEDTCVNIGLNSLKVPKYVPSDIDNHTSHLQTHISQLRP